MVSASDVEAAYRYLGQVRSQLVLEGSVITEEYVYAWTQDSLGVDHVVRLRIVGR